MANFDSVSATQVPGNSQELAVLMEDACLASIPLELLEIIRRHLSPKAFLSLRATCRRLHDEFLHFGVEDSELCCLTSPSRKLPCFAEHVYSTFGSLIFEWRLLQKERGMFSAESSFFQMFSTETKSETYLERVRCLFVQSSMSPRRLDSLNSRLYFPRLRSTISSVFGRFANLSILALKRFDLDGDSLALLGQLNLDALYLEECFFYYDFTSDQYRSGANFGAFVSLRKLYLAPTHFIDEGFEFELPPNLREFHLFLKHGSARSANVLIDATECKALERM
jgi:hypothetical protein